MVGFSSGSGSNKPSGAISSWMEASMEMQESRKKFHFYSHGTVAVVLPFRTEPYIRPHPCFTCTPLIPFAGSPPFPLAAGSTMVRAGKARMRKRQREAKAAAGIAQLAGMVFTKPVREFVHELGTSLC